ncbi:MAG: protein-L-isoaspartate(D-aspartate) O-methyltransferase [Gammaproteobacteria bacterium]|nr:protein-L-isoaspartate(D-aspartate) O-methyltransferase [Gammaproteobacteria bacterium]
MTREVKDRMENMIRDIENEVAFTRRYIGKDKLDARVMEAMKTVPRHEFVPSNQQLLAYINGPLSIGHGQTISQPYIVALMTDMMNINSNSVVLEIGTGSGYQAAILSTLVKKVYSMEVIPELMESAQQTFAKLGYSNIECRLGDGHEGWPEHAPYDAIIVTAAAEQIPDALVEQLKPDGNLVIPVGPTYGPQDLLLVRKEQDGEITTRDVLAVAFVPLVRTGSRH